MVIREVWIVGGSGLGKGVVRVCLLIDKIGDNVDEVILGFVEFVEFVGLLDEGVFSS